MCSSPTDSVGEYSHSGTVAQTVGQQWTGAQTDGAYQSDRSLVVLVAVWPLWTRVSTVELLSRVRGCPVPQAAPLLSKAKLRVGLRPAESDRSCGLIDYYPVVLF